MSLGDLALVTGAGSGIGRAVALALAADGHQVLAVGRRTEPLASLVAQASALAGAGTITAHSVDVAEPGAVQHLLDTAPGRLRVVVASAGTFARGPVATLAAASWDDQIRVNLSGAFHTLQASVTRMSDQPLVDESRGHIFTLNSGAGVGPFPTGAAYAASKHGLRGLVESLRGELTGASIKLTDLVVSATVESEMSAGRDVPMIGASAVAHTVRSCLALSGIATWDRVDLGQLR